MRFWHAGSLMENTRKHWSLATATLQVRIALAAYNKLGADYQTSHKENGVDRGWASEGIPEELLQEVTPVVGMVR